MHATDNPKSLHLYAVRGIGADVYIAGEQGLLLKLDARRHALSRAWNCRTRARLFGLTGNARSLSSPTACAAPCCAAPTAARTGSPAHTGLQVGPDGRQPPETTGASCSSARPATCSSAPTTVRSFARRQDRTPVPAAARGGSRQRDPGPGRTARRASRCSCPERAARRTTMHTTSRPRTRPSPRSLEEFDTQLRLAPGAPRLQPPPAGAWSLCALLTLVLGALAATQLTLNASFEKMIPQRPSLHPELPGPQGRPARPGQLAAHRGGEPRRATSTTRSTSTRSRRSTTSSS